MTTVSGNFVVVGLGSEPKYYWQGVEILGVKDIDVCNCGGVTLKVTSSEGLDMDVMRCAGIKVKEVK